MDDPRSTAVTDSRNAAIVAVMLGHSPLNLVAPAFAQNVAPTPRSRPVLGQQNAEAPTLGERGSEQRGGHACFVQGKGPLVSA